MSIALNPKDLERAERLLSGIKGGAQKALSRALNRTAQQTKTQMARSVTERYKIKAGEVKPAVTIQKAKPQTLEAQIEVKGYKIPLSHFGIRPKTDTTGSPHKTAKAEVIKGSPFEVKRGFVWRGNVFKRETDKRLPIQKLSGPAVPQMLQNEEILQSVEEHASEVLRDRLDHEITALLEGWSK